MHLFKFRQTLYFFRLFLFSLSLFLSSASYGFLINDCLKESYDVQVGHKGFPFGLTMVKLFLSKTSCNIGIRHEKLKYLHSEWKIDICRSPVHIKKGSGPIEVIKKKKKCSKSSKDDFCNEAKILLEMIADDGLIFAEGVKENLGTDHGRVYCSYLLLKKYFEDSFVFNASQNYEGLFEEKQESYRKEREDEGKNSIRAPRPVMEEENGEGTAADDDSHGFQSGKEEEEEEDSSSGDGSF